MASCWWFGIFSLHYIQRMLLTKLQNNISYKFVITVNSTHKMFLFAPNMQIQTRKRKTCNSNLYIHVLSNMCNSQKVFFLQFKIKYVILLENLQIVHHPNKLYAVKELANRVMLPKMKCLRHWHSY